MSPAVLALGLGMALGRPGLALIQPQLLDESDQVESVCAIALLACLFCVGLRLQAPFQWSRWRVPIALSTLGLLATWVLAAAVAKVLFDVTAAEALLIASVLAPTDAVLGSDLAGAALESEHEMPAQAALAAEGAFNGGFAVAAVAFVLALMGLEEKSSGPVGWLAFTAVWTSIGGFVAGAAIGAGMARWLQLLDFDRQTEMLEVVVVFATAALAYGAAEALHTSGFLSVVAAGLALGHGGRWRSRHRKRPLAPGVLKMAARVERGAALCVVVLLGALTQEMELKVSVLVYAAILIALIRPLAVRVGLSVFAPGTAHRRQLEWIGVRGAASLYCVAFAIDHGLAGAFAHELAGIALLVMAGSILAHGVSVAPLHTASPGALSS